MLFMHFRIIVALVIPCFWYVILGLVVLLIFLYSVLSWSNTNLSFLHTFGIILFLFLYSYSLLFLKHVVSSNLLQLHITQEAPLPPCNFNRSYHIEDNAQLGWGGQLRKRVFIVNTKYFGNLVYFCLILKFFLHGY